MAKKQTEQTDSMDLRKVRQRECAELIAACIQADVPLYIEGPPGGGKSALVKQGAIALGYEVQDERAASLDAVDVRGIPSVVDGRTRWNPATMWPRPQDAKRLLFLDEFNNAPAMVQSAFLEVVRDKTIGGAPMGEQHRLILAGNRAKDRAGAGRAISSMYGRAVVVELITDPDQFFDHAYAAGFHDAVIGFLKVRPDLVHAFEPAETTSPSPRGWEYVSKLIPQLGRTTRAPAVAGLVGSGAASEFVAFLDLYGELPDPNEIILHPKTAPVPKEEKPAALYAVACAVARKANENTAEAIYTYADRLPPEFAVFLATQALRTDRPGMVDKNSVAFGRFSQKHRGMFAGG